MRVKGLNAPTIYFFVQKHVKTSNKGINKALYYLAFVQGFN